MQTTTDVGPAQAPPSPPPSGVAPSRPGGVPARVVALMAAVTLLAAAVGYGVGTRTAGYRPSEADVGFLQDMIAHHEQAVEMAMTAAEAGDDPTVAGFEREVLTFQQYEIGLMEGTLRTWGHPREGNGMAMAWMDHEVPLADMPGLATEEQMDALDAATARDADALFLAMMSVHHLGGVQMADEGVARADSPFVRELAGRMSRNQTVEVREYSQARQRAGLPVPAGFTDPPTAPTLPGGTHHG